MSRNSSRIVYRLIRVLGLALVLPGVAGLVGLDDALAAGARRVTIAVVRDGPVPDDDRIDRIEAELRHLVGSEDEVVFDRGDRFDAGWDAARVGPALAAALADRSIDLVLGVGQLVAQAAARPDLELTKPYVGATLLGSGVPLVTFGANGGLAKANLSLVIRPRRTDAEIATIRDVFRASRVHVGIPQIYLANLAGIDGIIGTMSRDSGLQIVTVPLGPDWRQDLAAVGDDAGLFYLLPTPQLTRAERAALIAELTARRIPTISGAGPADLDLGALATFRTDTDQELIRRVALNLHAVIRGDSTRDLPVLLASEPRLVLDGRAAAATGFQPNYETRLLSQVRHPEALDAGVLPLDLQTLVALADTSNTSLSLRRQQIITSQRTRQSALGPLLPQLSLDARYSYYDLPSTGVAVPEQVGNLGLRISQMIYDDAAISAYRQTGRLLEASRLLGRAQQLDVFLAAERGYYDLLNAAIFRDLQLDNLRVTDGNLDIARTRAEVGQAGQDEVYRWEAEVAKQRTSVLDAEALVESYRIALNQILGTDQGTRWRPEPVEPRDLRFREFVDQVNPELSSPIDYEQFEAAAVAVALADAPELLALDHYLGAQDILVGQRKRTFFLPQIYADATLGNNFYQDPDQPDISGGLFEARVVASLPLFEGTRRINELKREESVRVELERERALTAEQIERRTRTTLRQIRSAVPGVGFSQVAAENSRLNFEVVREKYANGIVGITDLLEAQNTRLRDDLGALSARYSLLQQIAAFERNLSFFAAAARPEEINDLADRIRAAMASVAAGSN